MASRQQLYNAELQNDLEGKDKNIQNINQIDAVATGSVYVDPSLPEEIGKIDSLMAFKDLETAIRQTPDNYNIILRPGTYLFDGILEIRRSHVKLIGTGAIVSPITNGLTAGFLVTGSFVTIDGIIFDGLLTGSPTNTGTVIEVNRATNVEIKNCVIRDQNGTAITLTDRYTGCTIDNCSITNSLNGIVGGIVAGNAITGLVIAGNTIQAMRQFGINLESDNNVDVFGDIKIVGNDIVNVDQDGVSAACLRMASGFRDVIVSGNFFSRAFYGVFCSQSQRVTIADNSFAGFNGGTVIFDGCKSVTVNNNLLDGSNPQTGAPQAPIGIQMAGGFTVLNDAGPYVVSSNLISGITAGNKFLNIANTNDVTISSNQFTGAAYVQALDFNNLKINDNTFTISGNNQAIVLAASNRGWDGCTIADNKFKETGTRGRLISTSDPGGLGQKNITIVGNFSTEAATYAQGIYSNISGVAPGRAFLHSNSPASIVRTAGEYDNRSGWVNDYQNTFTASHINIPTDSTAKYMVAGIQVVGNRITGWSLPTGAQRRITFDTATVTLPQLAEVVNSLVHDLHISSGHGLIGLVAAGTPGYS